MHRTHIPRPVFLDPHARTHMPGPVLGKNSVKSNYKVKIPKMTLTCFQKLNIMLNCSKLRTEQVPFPGPWVSGPRSRVEQVPFPGPGTRDPTRAIKTGSCKLLRVPPDGSRVPKGGVLDNSGPIYGPYMVPQSIVAPPGATVLSGTLKKILS